MSDIRQGRIGQCRRCGGLLSFCLCDKAVDKAKMSDVKVTKSPHIPDDVRNEEQLKHATQALKSQLSTQETLVATLQEQKYEWDNLLERIAELEKQLEEATQALKSIEDGCGLHKSVEWQKDKAENASLRNAIKEAPHDVWCTRHDDDCSSFCWKALAVKT